MVYFNSTVELMPLFLQTRISAKLRQKSSETVKIENLQNPQKLSQ